MFFRVSTFHDPLHQSPGSHLVYESDTQVNEIPTGDEDQEKSQHLSRADDEFDHGSFPLFQPNEWNTATPDIRGELPIPLV